MINSSLKLMASRMGINPLETNKDNTIDNMSTRLQASGGYNQQNRMIRDKRKTLDKAVLYSYQGAKVQKINEEQSVLALINPNKVKQDYDDKVISIGHEYNYKPGDIFEWCNTGTYWLIYLQDLTELAYFKGDIRKCSYEINWKDKEGKDYSTYIALEGPPEKIIQSKMIQGNNLDIPNYSIQFMVPKNENTLKFFVRYQKFYLKNEKTCWRIEAVNSIGIPNIIRVSAVEYYSNEQIDDVQDGVVNDIKQKPIVPENLTSLNIIGETFIRPRQEYIYYIDNKEDINGQWSIKQDLPIKLDTSMNQDDCPSVKLKWQSNYSGQFELNYNSDGIIYSKTIVVESLF